MQRVCIMTEDERLYRELTLLLPEGDEAVSDPSLASLFILDLDTPSRAAFPAGAKILTVARHGKGKRADLLRPFSFSDFNQAYRAAAEAEEHPSLTATEERLFSLLRAANGAPVSRETLIRGTWGENGSDELLNLYIHYLRRKLEKDGKKRILASRGKGYYYQC